MKSRFCLTLLALLSFTLTAHAQTSRGTVSGIVTDPAGAVLAGADITLTNTDTNVERTATTNDEGFYRFDAVDLGNYSVTIESTGFGRATKTGIVVNANQTSTADAALVAGGQETTVEVSAEAGALLQTEAPVRGGNISPRQITELPIAGRNPVALALTLPGVVSNRTGVGIGTFVVNGGRGRSNNFLIDGTENNDISVAGQGLQITNPDAVQEVSVQTSNFDAEFGRAGGAVVNTITKSGTNDFNGTLSFQFDSSADDAITAAQSRTTNAAGERIVVLRGNPLSTTQYIPAATFGGPIFLPRFGEGGKSLYNGRNRNFFFVAYQETRFRAPGQRTRLTTPTQAGRDRLRTLFPAGTNRNVDLYLDQTASAVSTANPFTQSLGTVGGVNRGDIQFGDFFREFTNITTGKQFLARTDHRLSENDQLSIRFLSDRLDAPTGGDATFVGFDVAQANRYYNFLIAETHTFSPTVTNELRLAYNRIALQFPLVDPGGQSGTLSNISITNLATLGVATNLPQGRIANNYVIQDTLTKVIGDHTIRTGVDFLRQISVQTAPFNSRGSISYTASSGFSAFANFVDDFGGNSGAASRDFGSGVYNPSLYRTAVFAQDRWKATDSLTLTLGVRYENFGTVFNNLRAPAFTGLFNVDPVTFQGPYDDPNQVASDNNNIAPTVGISYSPAFEGGLLGGVFGERKTVLRAGYQLGYDSFFNNIASNAVASTPNNIVTTINSNANSTVRGFGNFFSQLPTTARAITPRDSQTLLAPNLVNPYYQRFSGSLQRELPFGTVVEISYVGSRGVKLFINEDANPLVRPELRITPAAYAGPRNCTPGGNITAAQALPGFPAGSQCPITGRLDNLQGPRTVRTNGGSSTFHSGQIEVRRRFADNYQFTGAYTFSKYLSNADEVFAVGVATASSVFALPQAFGGSRLDRAVSVNDRPHRAVFSYVAESPFFRDQRGVLGHLLGGYQIGGVTTFESGVPYTIFNGFDSDGVGGANERPNFNPNGQRGVRAVPEIDTRATIAGANNTTIANPNFGALIRYFNPDVVTGFTATGAPIFGNPTIDPNTAQFIANPAFIPNNTNFAGVARFGTLGRNSERSPGLNNTNLTLVKRTRISENMFLEARGELFNVFNRPQFPSNDAGIASNLNTAIGGRFLNPDTPATNGGGRTVRYLVRLTF